MRDSGPWLPDIIRVDAYVPVFSAEAWYHGVSVRVASDEVTRVESPASNFFSLLINC